MNKLFTKIGVAFVGMAMAIGVGVAVGGRAQVREAKATTSTYTFTSTSWADSTSSWTSNKNGTQTGDSRGIAIQKAASGAGAITKDTFSDITKVSINCSRSGNGVGSISVSVGSTEVISVSSFNTTATTEDSEDLNNLSGKVSFTVTCTTSTLYVKSVTIVYGGSGGGEDPEPSGDVVISNGKYTFAMAKNDSATDYTVATDVTSNGLQWNVEANQATANAWRVGGKNLSNVDRTFYTKAVFPVPVSKLNIDHKGLSTNSLTVNSITLIVASNSTFTTTIQTITKTDLGLSKDTTGTISFVPTAAVWPKDSYFKIKFNFTNSAGSNYALVLKDIEIYDGTDKSAVNDFVTANMHMTDYDPDLDNTGGNKSCLGESGYYRTAKTALTAMSATRISLFQSDDFFNNAQARYEAWAVAYGDTTPYSTSVTPKASSNYMSIGNGTIESTTTIIVIISLMSFVALGGFFMLKKKKEQ